MLWAQTSVFGFWATRLRSWVKRHEICITVKSQQSVKHTFFSFLASSIVLRGATPRTIANARPSESKKSNSNINIVISELYNSVDKWSGYPVLTLYKLIHSLASYFNFQDVRFISKFAHTLVFPFSPIYHYHVMTFKQIPPLFQEVFLTLKLWPVSSFTHHLPHEKNA